MATGTITDKINNVVALLIDQCNCETPSEIKAAFQELQAALNAQLAGTRPFAHFYSIALLVFDEVLGAFPDLVADLALVR